MTDQYDKLNEQKMHYLQQAVWLSKTYARKKLIFYIFYYPNLLVIDSNMPLCSHMEFHAALQQKCVPKSYFV